MRQFTKLIRIVECDRAVALSERNLGNPTPENTLTLGEDDETSGPDEVLEAGQTTRTPVEKVARLGKYYCTMIDCCEKGFKETGYRQLLHRSQLYTYQFEDIKRVPESTRSVEICHDCWKGIHNDDISWAAFVRQCSQTNSEPSILDSPIRTRKLTGVINDSSTQPSSTLRATRSLIQRES